MGLYDVPRTRACFVSTDRASDTLDTVARRPLFAERSDATTLTGPTGHPREERSWVAGGKWGRPPLAQRPERLNASPAQRGPRREKKRGPFPTRLGAKCYIYYLGPSGFCSLCPRDRRCLPGGRAPARAWLPRRAARPSLSASVCALLGLRSAVRRSEARSSCL